MQGSKLKITKYQPFVISGCSGVGKGTLIGSLLESFPELFQLSISYTTRKPREVETHGKDYFFVSPQQFQKVSCSLAKLIKEDGFMEHCHVHGEYYGTNEAYVQSIVSKGKICLLDVDIQGAEKIQAKHPNWNYIFIQPPSLEQLKMRLVDRGMNTQADINKRVENASKELARLKQLPFYKVITNDNVQTFYKEVINHINNVYHILIQMDK